MIAIVAEGDQGRLFLSPTDTHIDKLLSLLGQIGNRIGSNCQSNLWRITCTELWDHALA